MTQKSKLKEKARRNAARIKSCKLHDFDWKKSLADEKARQDEIAVSIPIPIFYRVCCRCKNCGGKMPLIYAAPYMDAVAHMKKLKEETK